jgi:hypothetical protein
VMRNEKLNHQLSFMPPEMWDVVAEATKKRSRRYEQQWADPHYLHPSAVEYTFIRHEPDSGIVVEKMQRCASITSIKELHLEVDEVLAYLKSHNGIVDQPINENNNIVEDAVRTAPDTGDLRGCIPSANEIDIRTVAANRAISLRMIQNILPNDSALKRTHNTVPPGHVVHPSKVQKPNPQASLNSSNDVAHQQDTFNRMSAYGSPGYMANSYINEPTMDTSHPFAELPRDVVGYTVWRDDNSSSDNSSYNNSRWNSKMLVRNKGKEKGKGKSFKKGKRDPTDPYWTIPEFGKAIGDSRIVIFLMADLIQPTNPFRKRNPAPFQRSNLPGYVVLTPEVAFTAARKRHDQPTDQDLMMVYHKALRALYRLRQSPGSYYLHDEMKQPRTLHGQKIQYLNGQSVQDLVLL